MIISFQYYLIIAKNYFFIHKNVKKLLRLICILCTVKCAQNNPNNLLSQYNHEIILIKVISKKINTEEMLLINKKNQIKQFKNLTKKINKLL